MEYTHLGRTGLRVSRLAVGGACFGYVSGEMFGDLGMTEERSFQIMDLALEHGINLFDTADIYGWDQGVGLSETAIGHWLAQGGQKQTSLCAVIEPRKQHGLGCGVDHEPRKRNRIPMRDKFGDMPETQNHADDQRGTQSAGPHLQARQNIAPPADFFSVAERVHQEKRQYEQRQACRAA